MVLFTIPVDKGDLINRWKAYEQWWYDRYANEDEPGYCIDLLPDGSAQESDVVRFELTLAEECKLDGHHEFRLDFYCNNGGDTLELFLTFNPIKQLVFVTVYIDDCPGYGDSVASLVVSYSPMYGRKIYYGTSVSPMHVQFVERLFVQILDRMGFIPDPPLDFDSVYAFAEKQTEIEKRCEKIWGELADSKHKVSEAWDDFVTQYDR